MITKIQKWGNSLGVRIPKTLAQDAAVTEGTSVRLTVEDARLVIVPLRNNSYDLADLLSQVTAKNLHREVDSGGPAGREAW